ncbi:MAG TPA: ribosome small subunit-dependent GTPase A [Clostridiales bacterium]|nr:ribosome small subunit-dependent GTPase A [Clostridiales bacterium]
MKGKIIKGIAGFYYIHAENNRMYTCKAKGIFRNINIKPLVGDNVMIQTNEDNKYEGIITEVLPRKNELLRPAVANVDQALVIFATAEPNPNLNLLDRFLITMEMQNIETIICFNKTDKVVDEEISLLQDVYKSCGYKIIFSSVKDDLNLPLIMDALKNKTTVMAGPSGVGKSSIINILHPDANMEVGEISEKIKRGKHTTRHSELISIDKNTYIMDTPGFSSLLIDNIHERELKEYFREFQQYEDQCKFTGCSHINEPHCAVKNALDLKLISRIRYDNYILIYKELENTKKY